MLGTAIAGGTLLPASIARQQMVLIPNLMVADGLSTWLLLALAVHLLAKGPKNWTPWLALMALGTAVASMSGHMLVTAAALTLVVALSAVDLWREGVPARRYANLVLGTVLVLGGLYVHLSRPSGSLVPSGQSPLEPEAWAPTFLGGWALLGLWPLSLLAPGREHPQGSILRLAVAVLLLRTFNLGPWPSTAALVGSVAVALPLVVEVFRNTAALHEAFPCYCLLALAPVGGPLGPAAAMACEFIYPLWALKPTARDVGSMATAVAWLASSLVPLWLGAATMHQAGLTAYGALLLFAGLLALSAAPEAHRPGPTLLLALFPPLLFPVAWRYLVAPAADALYQGLGPMFVTADPWSAVFFPSGDMVLSVLPFPTLALTLPALLALLAVVARYIRSLERRF